MSIYESAIRRPVMTILVFAGIIFLGLFSLKQLPIDQFPEIEAPYVTVMCTYPGANSSEIETNISEKLENSLNSVDGLKKITSQSKENISMVSMEFEWGFDMDVAMNDIRSNLDVVIDQLPDEASRPMVFKFNTSMMPIIMYAVTADESSPSLHKIIDDNIIDPLNRVDGIGMINQSGSPIRYVYIDIDQDKLDAYHLSLEQVGGAIQNNNLNLASGSVKMGKDQYQVRVNGEFIESSEINDLVVSQAQDGTKIYVRDIATVKDTVRDLAIDEKINGLPGTRLFITKQTDGNTVDIVNNVDAKMAEIQKTLPPDVKVEKIFDSADEISNAISGLSSSIFYALIFVVLVVFFFLGKWRATLIIALTIPIALIASFIYLKGIGSSINIISLCSLTVAIGMVVDDAIVVLENITKHVERGARPVEAAIYATNEVWVSVIATTLVVCAVFIPLTMLGGQAGIFFTQLGWIVTITVCTSTLVAISLTPMLASKLLKARRQKVDENGVLIDAESHSSDWYQKHVVAFLDKIDHAYSNALRWCLNHKIISVIVVTLIFFASFIPVGMGFIGTDFMPQSDNGRLTCSIEFQTGSRIEESAKICREIEKKFVFAVPEIENIVTSVGSDPDGGIGAIFTSTNNQKAQMTVVLSDKKDRKRSQDEIANVLRSELQKMPDVIDYSVGQNSMGAEAPSVDIKIFGYDIDQTNILAEQLKSQMKLVPGAGDIVISRERDQAELSIVFDKLKLAQHGLNEATAAMFVRNRLNGMKVGYLKESGDEYDIYVRLQEEDRNSMRGLNDMTLMSSTGPLKLSEVATIGEYWAPPQLDHESRQRIVTVKVSPVATSLGQLAAAAKKEVSKIEVPTGVQIEVGGTYEDQQETFGDMGLLFLMIVILVYIVMASQFESYAKPFVIIMSIPFAITGVIMALWISGTTLNMIGALGVIMLVGIVVKNGIVLVDYIDLMRERGHSLYESIALSGASRLRPVLMTAMTTVLGMVPMALSTSEGSEMWVSMGIVVIGGTVVSTMITLFIVPILYAITTGRQEKKQAKRESDDYIFLDIDVNQYENGKIESFIKE